MAKLAKLAEQSPSTRLDPILKEMAKLQSGIKELSGRYEVLKEEAFPLVEAAGDVYEVDGIKAQIVRGQTWEIDAIGLLKKFGAKVHSLMTVSASKFRKAFETDMLGTKAELKGIAKLVDETPKFRLSQQ